MYSLVHFEFMCVLDHKRLCLRNKGSGQAVSLGQSKTQDRAVGIVVLVVGPETAAWQSIAFSI